MGRTLLYRAIQTPDGTVLATRHRHDYKTYTDTITNEMYMIDGGLEPYYRVSVNNVKPKMIEYYHDDNIEILRNVIKRGEKLIKNCSNKHLENIIEYVLGLNDNITEEQTNYCYFITAELLYRKKNNIYIEDEI